MSTTIVAILVLLLLGSTCAYFGFRRDARTGIGGMLGLALVGPCLAVALWCLWWSASQEGHQFFGCLLSWPPHRRAEAPTPFSLPGDRASTAIAITADLSMRQVP
jgi:hypothetical protein